MGNFGSLDWGILAAFFLGSIILGSYFAKSQRNIEDYLLAGRQMSWLPVAISIMATNTSAGSYMGIPTYVFAKNLMFYFNCVTLVLVTPLVIILFLRFYYQLKVYTAYEYLEKRFNLLVRSIASILFIFLRLCWLAMMIYATSIALAEITGIAQVTCALCLGLGTSAYTMLGGMKGVIWTDVVQGSVFVLGILVMALFILIDFNWNVGELYLLAESAGRTQMFDFSLDPTTEVSFWGALFGFSVINLASYGVDQVVIQRYLTARDLRTSEKSVIANACIDFPASSMLFLVAIGIFSYFQRHPEALPQNFDPNRVLPFFVVTALPTGVSGLVIAGILAATMSSISSGINSITTACMADFYQRYFKRRAPAEHYLIMARSFCVIWGVVATTFALFVSRLGTILEISVKTNSFFTGILLGIFLLGILSLRATWQGTSLGALASSAVVFYVGFMTDISFLWYAPLGLVLTIGLGYLFSLCFAPRDPMSLKGLVKGYEESRFARAAVTAPGHEVLPRL